MSLSESEIERYRRQLLVEGWDQEKLKHARVLIVGIGGLGGVSATYLAAAGVGHLRICDRDTVELSNLNRQILFTADDINRRKAVLAAEKLSRLNPEIYVEGIADTLTESNARDLTSGCDLIIDGLDNHSDRLILNKTAFVRHLPFVYGAVDEWMGQASFFHPPETACLACLVPRELSTPRPIPVYGAMPGVVGSLQATLALRYLLTGQNPLANTLLIVHADTMMFETVAFEKRPRCAVCGKL